MVGVMRNATDVQNVSVRRAPGLNLPTRPAINLQRTSRETRVTERCKKRASEVLQHFLWE